MTRPGVAERSAALEFINAEITRELEWLTRSFDTVDTKTLGLIGFAAVAGPFLALNGRDGALPIIAIAVFAMAVVTGFAALRPRKLSSGPQPEALLEAYSRAVSQEVPNTKESLLATVVATKAQAYRMSFETARKKLAWYRRCERLLLLALVLAFFSFRGGSDDGSDPGSRQPVSSTTSSTRG